MANQHVLVAAREALGLTQAQLAARLNNLVRANARISQGYVSRVEAGALTVTGERVGLFAEALECSPRLLSTDARIWSLGEGCLYHRHRASTRASTLRKLHARINLLRLHLQRLAELADQPREVADAVVVVVVERADRQLVEDRFLEPERVIAQRRSRGHRG